MIRKAFTMIELLTVIAIIALLAAIVYPAFTRARAQAFKNGDMSNMNQIRIGLQLYDSDQGAYPPQLLGYASVYFDGVDEDQVIPANQARGFLPPQRANLSALQPHNDQADTKTYTTAVWPTQDPKAVGTDPQLDLNGDGQITSADDFCAARQAHGPTTTVTRWLSASDYSADRLDFGRDENIGAVSAGPSSLCDGTQPTSAFCVDSYFYNVSGYDVSMQPASGGSQAQLRYALFWTAWGLDDEAEQSACGVTPGPGNADDDPRQLGYANPPDNTVVTWNSYWRDYGSDFATPLREKNDIVLFLGGGTKLMDSLDVNQSSWRILSNN